MKELREVKKQIKDAVANHVDKEEMNKLIRREGQLKRELYETVRWGVSHASTAAGSAAVSSSAFVNALT